MEKSYTRAHVRISCNTFITAIMSVFFKFRL